MNNRTRKKLPSLALAFLLFFSFFIFTPLSLAAGDSSVPSTPSESDDDSGGNNGNVDYTGAGDFTVTGYRTAIWNPGWNPADPEEEFQDISSIAAGQRFTLILNIRDTRIPAQFKPQEQRQKLKPKAKMNSSSFKPAGDSLVFDRATGLSWKDGGLSYSLHFDIIYTGQGNSFECDIYYDDNILDLPVYPYPLALNNVVEDSSSSDEDASGSTRGTSFALQSASYGDANISAGSNFKLDVSMIATNGSYGLDNVSASLVPDKEITFSTGTSTVYIGSVAPGDTVSLSFDLKAAAAAEDGSYKVTIGMHGVNAKDGTEVNTDVDISIPIIQPDRLEISNAQVPDYITAGEGDGSGYASINLVNKGKSDVYNVSGEVIGEGLSTDEGSVYIGTMAAGSQSTADFNIVSDTPGEHSATVEIIYENVRGEEKKLTHVFKITVGEGAPVQDNSIYDGFDEFEEEPESTIPLVWIIIGAVVVAGAVVVIVILRKRRKAKLQAELEDDDDEDF